MSQVNPDRLAGILIMTGAAVGLVSTTVTLWTVFSVMGWLAFLLVLVFGVYVFRKRPEARLLAAATLWFAPLEAVSSALIIWLAGYMSLGGGRVWASAALVGTALTLVGGFVGLLRGPTSAQPDPGFGFAGNAARRTR